MVVSYDKLRKMFIDKKMSFSEFKKNAELHLIRLQDLDEMNILQ